MPCYIGSNDERFYVAVEPSYGTAASVLAEHRFAAVQLRARQRTERPERRDKTGTRTFPGLPEGLRRQTDYDIRAYLAGWTDTSRPPSYGPLFQAALGASPLLFAGANVGTGSTATTLSFASPHGLTAGQAVTFGGELRFVTGVIDAQTVQLNSPFTLAPTAGSPIGATVTYKPASDLPSVSLFDFWSPATAVQRFLNGAGVDQMTLRINGDFHEFSFEGPARDLVDDASFTGGVAGLSQFPAEPAITAQNTSIVPGHLGQAWLGSVPSRFHTITSAEFRLENNIDVRDREFGIEGATCLVAGERRVRASFSLYEKSDAATRALYQAARQQSPISVMFQLGQQTGQLCGVLLKSVVPEVPEFDDGETRLQWRFSNSQAQGSQDDEVYVAFG